MCLPSPSWYATGQSERWERILQDCSYTGAVLMRFTGSLAHHTVTHAPCQSINLIRPDHCASDTWSCPLPCRHPGGSTVLPGPLSSVPLLCRILLRQLSTVYGTRRSARPESPCGLCFFRPLEPLGYSQFTPPDIRRYSSCVVSACRTMWFGY